MNNTIAENPVGINLLNSSNPTIKLNNIISNKEYSIYLYASPSATTNAINVTNNWWGTLDSEAIVTSIRDYKYNAELGNVAYLPILSEPNYAAPTYTKAIAEAGGSISPNGYTRLNVGDTQTFTITANNGYHILDVKINDTSVGPVNSYTIEGITGATTILATFAVNLTSTPTSQPTANSNSNPTTNPASNPTTEPTQSPTTQPSPSPTIPEFPATIALITALLASATVATLLYKRINFRIA